ncbi:MAG: hypothetical protein J6X78_06020 [Treponema sp.]|nr:hypothetical protein [Treponema sp.]
MKKVSSFIADLILSIGVAIILFLIISAILIQQFESNLLLNTFSILAAIFGLCVTIIGIGFTKKIHQIFMGLELLFWGTGIWLRLCNYIPFAFVEVWPVIGVSAGIFLFIAGIIRYKKLLFRYFIPSITLFLLGVWFMLFSLKIIKISFRDVAIVGGPLFFIMSGIFIIGFFLLQRKYTNLVVSDENTEIDAEDIIEDDKQGE